MPRLLYNVHVWVVVKDLDVHRLQAAFREMIKSVVRGPMNGFDAHRFSSAEVAALASMLDPAVQVSGDRLRYLQRAVRHMPELFWQVVEANDSRTAWKALILKDCLWLKKISSEWNVARPWCHVCRLEDFCHAV